MTNKDLSLLNERLREVAGAALDAGFEVYILDDKPTPCGFFYATKPGDPGFVVVQIPTHRWGDLSVDAPIPPSREYGSGVIVDHDNTVAGMLKAMTATCAAEMVMPRFVKNPRPVRNYGRNCLDRWPGGAGRFVKLQASN